MQVDTVQLRKAAARLRQDVAKRLRSGQSPGPDVNVEAAFDLYTTAGPFREAASAWAEEIDVLIRATIQLAEALESAADDYDRSDGRAVARLTATR
jgi:hypothetical protein